jgi:hypothetical protein
MNLEEKTELYETYLSDRSRTIQVQIPKGPKISFLRCWDYKGDMKHVHFKTLNHPEITHENMKIEEVDLSPIANITYFQITITR